MFDPVGNEGWYRRGGPRARFGQQPIEAGYTVEAAAFAAGITRGERAARYRDLARSAAAWFFGRNRLGATLYDLAPGACADGLDAGGASQQRRRRVRRSRTLLACWPPEEAGLGRSRVPAVRRRAADGAGRTAGADRLAGAAPALRAVGARGRAAGRRAWWRQASTSRCSPPPTRARPARWPACAPRPYEEDPEVDAKVWECLHIAHAFERAAEFDLIHNHVDFLPLTYARLVDTPVVTTIHGFSSPRILPVYERYDADVAYVAISDADRSPGLHYAATVHHGIDLAELTYSRRRRARPRGPRPHLAREGHGRSRSRWRAGPGAGW